MEEGLTLISTTEAQTFAKEWIESWNSHDLDRILSHYSDDFEMTSPFLVSLMNEPTGTIKGKENVQAYWTKAFERIPDLRFELIEVLTSVNSMAIYYHAVLGKRGVELLFFDKNGKVARGIAHYSA